jgi:hypothetical protein
MSSSSRIRIRRIRETTPGTTPAGNMLVLPFARYKVSAPTQREKPDNVRSDRQVTDNPATTRDVSGNASADMHYQDYDGLHEEVMCSVYSAAATATATTIAAVTSGNKLTHATSGAWGTAGIVAGDVVRITGLVTNGTDFVALVGAAPSGNDLPLTWPTLLAESAGPSVTVKVVGRCRLGTSLLTATYERLNLATTKGSIDRGIGVNAWDLEFPQPNKARQSFGFVGLSKTRASAALANASTAAAGYPLVRSNNGLFGGSNAALGIGFRIDGTLLPDLRVNNLKLSVKNPLLAAGAAGSFGPLDLSLDGEFEVMLSGDFYRNSDDAEDLLDYAADTDSVQDIGFGWIDRAGASGHLQYALMRALQPSDDNESELAKTGREMVSLAWVAKAHDVATMLQLSKLGSP